MGSSARIRRGPLINARAMATRCCSPPGGAGAKCKFDECGLNCKPRAEVGPFKVERDKVGVKLHTTSGAKAVLEGTKCSLQGKLAGRVCRAWRN